ncbi:hypothetical protein P152DRAFT_476434 [Eremomyces bilateralis CBS 781.70]|uniref:Uncharacterized protein n=1 Tax=Eremomyces bilateralis CBS 781.70 TaxID=1392243 RepID=A0A6G1FUQ3_9PEZI|nr:uncharacterized protein P152DRAFT_476434 [Eremomyces bilateralis CBS 781.70]KAF1809537.1 hypothetical protein P152DRAFT_476434 [Eremomyces bilateralis CBS 781.70]
MVDPTNPETQTPAVPQVYPGRPSPLSQYPPAMDPASLDVKALAGMVHNAINNLLHDPKYNPWTAESYKEAAARSSYRLSELKRFHGEVKKVQNKYTLEMATVVSRLLRLEGMYPFLPRGTDGNRYIHPSKIAVPNDRTSEIVDVGNGFASLSINTPNTRATEAQKKPFTPIDLDAIMRGEADAHPGPVSAPLPFNDPSQPPVFLNTPHYSANTGGGTAAHGAGMLMSNWTMTGNGVNPNGTAANHNSATGTIESGLNSAPLTSATQQPGIPLPSATAHEPMNSAPMHSAPLHSNPLDDPSAPPTPVLSTVGPFPHVPTYAESLYWMQPDIASQPWWNEGIRAVKAQNMLREQEAQIFINRMLMFATEKEVIDAIMWSQETRKGAEMRHLSVNPPAK